MVAALALAANGFAQCPPGGVTFTNQAQVDNFIIQYPNCTEINGDVVIDEADITSLAGLANITAITGGLEIREVEGLESLDGLENLETVGTDLVLREVEDLENIEALSSLVSVGGELTIRSCPELVTLDGLENLTTVGLGLIIRDCESLISIEGLTSVEYVGEILEVVENPILESLAGLENVTTIIGGDEGALVIEGNDALTSLEGFGNAETVMTGGVTISTNGSLSYCAVPAICNFLQNPPEGAPVLIGLNVTGCNSDTEVIAACEPLPLPTITSFTPDNGCAGTTITITGTDFAGITAITIGGTGVASYTVDSPTQITAIVGEGTTGTVTVTNTTGDAVSAGSFTVLSAPDAVEVTVTAEGTCLGEVQQLSAASGEETDNITWSPVTGLYEDISATVPYTGTALATVYAKPGETTIYEATYTNGSGCEATGVVTVTVVNTLPPDTIALQLFCPADTVADLMADGENIQWYDAEEDGNLIAPGTALTNGMTYFASQTIDGCESAERASATVTIVETVNAPSGGDTQTINVENANEATLQDIIVSISIGGSITWYASEEDALAGTNPLPPDTILESGVTYYATQTIGSCTSEGVFSVTVDVVLGQDDFDMQAFTFYPNPVTDILNISYNSDITAISVHNMLGQQVLVQQPNAVQAVIDMAALQSGTYMVSITAGKAIKTIKLVKV